MMFINLIKNKSTTAEGIIIILISLAVIAWFLGIFALIYNGYYGKKLSSHLRKNKALWKKRRFFWEPLANFMTFDPAIWSKFNPIRTLRELVRYIFNGEDTSDLEILSYKRRLRVSYTIFFFSFATFIVLLFTVLIIFIISGGRM